MVEAVNTEASFNSWVLVKELSLRCHDKETLFYLL